MTDGETVDGNSYPSAVTQAMFFSHTLDLQICMLHSEYHTGQEIHKSHGGGAPKGREIETVGRAQENNEVRLNRGRRGERRIQ